MLYFKNVPPPAAESWRRAWVKGVSFDSVERKCRIRSDYDPLYFKNKAFTRESIM